MSKADTYRVDKAKHALAFLDKMLELKEENLLCDFIIKVGSEKIHAHRHVLCAGSKFFKHLLSEDSKELQTSVFEWPDSDAICANICIDYLYGKTNAIPEGKYEKLMKLAKTMKIGRLCTSIASLLEENLNVESFYTAKAITKIHECRTLEKKCTIFGRLNFVAIAKKEEFLKLDKNFVKELIRLKNIRVSEKEKLNALLRWLNFETGRMKDTMEMVKLIDLAQIPFEHRQRLIEEESLINGNQDCLLHFTLSLLDSMNINVLNHGGKGSKSLQTVVLILDDITWHLQQFNPKDGTLVQKHEIIEEMRFWCSAVTINDYIYVLMCNEKVFRLRYADDNATWEQLADMPNNHGLTPPAVVFSERIYVVCGGLKAVDMYDPELNKWYQLTYRPVSSLASGTIAFKDKIYSFGGRLDLTDDGKISNKVSVFDPVALSWTEMPPMKGARAHVSPVGLDQKIYVVGGDFGRKLTRTFECYDVTTETWTTLRRLKRPRFAPHVFVINGSIFAFGGASADNMFEKYDIETNEWEIERLPVEKLRIRTVVKVDVMC